MRKKYDIELFTNGSEWQAQLTCHCGERPERKNIQRFNLGDLLFQVSFDLVKHELGHAPMVAHIHLHAPTDTHALPRLSIVGGLCVHCGEPQTEALKCPGCGHIDPATKAKPQNDDKADCFGIY